jgi:hypothetical protein
MFNYFFIVNNLRCSGALAPSHIFTHLHGDINRRQLSRKPNRIRSLPASASNLKADFPPSVHFTLVHTKATTVFESLEDSGFLCNKIPVFRDTIKRKPVCPIFLTKRWSTSLWLSPLLSPSYKSDPIMWLWNVYETPIKKIRQNTDTEISWHFVYHK